MGAPGTGKTTTLGMFLTEYMVDRPESKILLLSTTNHAVDQALLAVDKELEKINRNDLRKGILRIGNHFLASDYKGREHLIPVSDKELVKQLSKLESEKPDSSNIHAYDSWKRRIEKIKNEIRSQFDQLYNQSQLSAMTTTLAVFDIEKLKHRHPYDLIVFDEASQVSLAHSLALAPLGKVRLYAGDPKQLSPIVRCDKEDCKQWLGKSVFNYMSQNGENTCLLNEQSRMASTICKIVSNTFYGGNLIVAHDAENNKNWLNERRVNLGSRNKNVIVKNIDKDGTWSRKYKGFIRYDSALSIVEMIQKIDVNPDINTRNVVVLTPFRAQRWLIKAMLSRDKLNNVKVSTVHRAQGGQYSIVLFDPVVGNEKFIKENIGKQLINVAISRTQAKLILFLSPGDKENTLFNNIDNMIKLNDSNEKYCSICEYYNRLDFPECLIDKVISIKNTIGKVTQLTEGGEKLTLIDINTGQSKEFLTSFFENLCQNK